MYLIHIIGQPLALAAQPVFASHSHRSLGEVILDHLSVFRIDYQGIHRLRYFPLVFTGFAWLWGKFFDELL